jgi:glycosyltransferase involved in cell wall biosynthesis
MEVALELSALLGGGGTGISRYCRGLSASLARIGDRKTGLYLCYRLSRLRKGRPPELADSARCRTKILAGGLNRLFYGRIDIFHALSLWMPPAKNLKKVVTLYDVFSAVSEEFAGEGFRRRRLRTYARLSKEADAVVAISRRTKEDFLSRYTPRGEVVVIYPGVSPRFSPCFPEKVEKAKKTYGIRGAYLLCVGEISRRKNIPRLLTAYRGVRLALGGDAPRLVFAGPPRFGHEEAERTAGDLGLSDSVLFLGYVPDEALPVLYAGAELLFFPSSYEGFGFPVLEAMACGTPVVASRNGAVPEVAGDAAVLVDPSDPEAIAGAALRILGDEDLRGDLRRRGIRRARAFSWERTARETLDLYDRVLREA